jgi:hypothetical protein
MKKGRFILAIAMSSVVAGGALALLEACSSDNGNTGSTPVFPPAEAGAKDTSTSEPDTSMPGTDSSMTDAGSDCGKAASLHPNSGDGGIYCPFSATGAGGKNIYCLETEQCCENPSGSGASTCVAKGTACPVATATVWECEDPTDCQGGKKCCAHSGDGGTVTIADDTCGPYLSKFSGTRCETTCGTGELVVCEKQAHCTTGTCTAVKPKGNDIGVCR